MGRRVREALLVAKVQQLFRIYDSAGALVREAVNKIP